MAWMPTTRAPRLPLTQNSTGQGLILTTLALLALGVVIVQGAMVRPAPRDIAWYARVDWKHAIYAGMAILVLLTAWRVDYRRLAAKGNFPWLAAILFALSLIGCGLVHVPGLGVEEGGKYRWLKLIHAGSLTVNIQPSEMVKFTVVIFLAAWLTRESVNIRSFWKTFVPAIIIVGVAMGVTINQGLSTGIVVGMAGVTTLLLAGVPWYYLTMLIPAGAGLFYKMATADEYHRNRILAWLDPTGNNPAAYQAWQSLMAILTGGLTGKGLGQPTVGLGFLPESSSDFIYSVLCEQLGLVGGILVCGLLIMWMWHARKSALRAGDKLGQVLAASLGLLIAMQAVMHIAVALVVAPTTGQVLPFVSYGGTSLMITTAAVAIMVSVTSRGRADGTADLFTNSIDCTDKETKGKKKAAA